MLSKILVPVRGDGKGDNVLAHAAALARRYGAHIEVMHSTPSAKDLEPFGVPVPAILKAQFSKYAAETAKHESETLHTELRGLAQQLGLTYAEAPNGHDGPTVSWISETGRQADVIKYRGRLADLIAVPQPDRKQKLGINTLRSALFDTGRPVMMCPDQAAPPALGARVTIAWNGSTEAARAVSLTLEIIEHAEAVTILTAGSVEAHGATAADLLAYLAVRGVRATLDQFAPSRSIGQSLLDKSAEHGADLMIMGAYSESHEREVIFGGNTQTVVDRATMPVVLVH